MPFIFSCCARPFAISPSDISYFFQVELVRAQLRRATEKYGGPVKSNLLSRASSQPLDKEIDLLHSGNSGIGTLHIENIGNIINLKKKY